jgi:bifunctional ADP-heptose synthase (sugar kinase/adenylyltransferase)
VYADTAGNLSTETKAVQNYGGKVYFTKSELRSSSSLINAMIERSDEEVNIINHVKKFIKDNPIQSLAKKLKNKKVTVIGEIILDEYIFTESLGKSGKHPLVAEREIYRKGFYGGIVPLVNTLNSVLDTSQINVISIQNSNKLLNNSNCFDNLIFDNQYSDIVKTRYINEKTNTFMYELYKLEDIFISKINEQSILEKLRTASSDCDLLIALDFGHGLITPQIRDFIHGNFDNFALNVQKNAGNKGFSSLSKYKSANLIIMNGAELELELKQQGLNVTTAAKMIHKNMSAKIVAVTDGGNGLILTNGDQVVRVPTFKVQNIVDRTGAGDALFAVISLFSLVVEDLIVLGYLGNLAGSLSLSWFANEKSVTIEDIIQSITYGLK